MNVLKLEKRTGERTDSIRRRIERLGLPAGERRAILGQLEQIDLIARKAGKQLATAHRRGPVTNALYDARTEDDMAAQAEARKAVFQAMMAGRRVSLKDSREFRASQMHTVVCKIRQDISRKGLQLAMCDEWVRPEGERPYKQYWIVKTGE